MTRSILVVAVAGLLLAGCQEKEATLAACKVKAIEAYKPGNVEVDNQSADYVYYCMLAAGYRSRVDETCQGRIGNMMDFCWR